MRGGGIIAEDGAGLSGECDVYGFGMLARPDHSTIADFVSSMEGEMLPFFRDIWLVCEESGLLGGTFFALDGCNIPSNASKE
jgi:hypothetical protein